MILISGATGTIGSYLVRRLASRPEVRALARSDAAAAELTAAGVEAVRGDLDDLRSLELPFAGVRSLFLLTPFSPEQQAREERALDAAEAAGVRRVVKLSIEFAGDKEPIALARPHRAIEQRLASSGFDVVVLRSVNFASNLVQQARLIADGRIVYPSATITHVDPRDVADAAAAALTADEPPLGTHLLTGPSAVSYEDVARELSDALGRRVEHRDVPVEAWRGGLLDTGLPGFAADALAELYETFQGRGNAAPTDDIQRLTGSPARPLSRYIAEELAPSLTVPTGRAGR